MSAKSAYQMFKDCEANDNISFSTFTRSRPNNFLQVAQKHIQCLCEYCANVDELLKAVNKQCDKASISDLSINNKDCFIKTTLCSIDEGARCHKPSCISRECTECGLHTVYFFVFTEKIEWYRPARIPRKALQGTRKLHAVKTKGSGVVHTRPLICIVVIAMGVTLTPVKTMSASPNVWNESLTHKH